MKRISLLTTAIGLFCLQPLFAQLQYSWSELPNAPVAASRHDDMSFVNERIGWVVNTRGQIFKTSDGGESWTLQLLQTETDFRSVVFLDSLKGFVGNLGTEEYGGGTDTTILYQTTNGGQSFESIDHRIIGPKPRGVCGMYAVDDSVIFAVGRVRGPAFFMKTTDGGASWHSRDMSDLAAGLIDCYFVSPDTGIIVGLTNESHPSSSGVVLRTTDGGDTWETAHVSGRTGEWCWKISFPSRKVGYVSMQRNLGAPIYFLKTTDGGVSWSDKLFNNNYYYVQGIGFIDEQNGWIGGNSSNFVYKTTDGGDTWSSAGFGLRVNRFRMVNDSLGYAAGITIYKLKGTTPVGIATDGPPVREWQLYQNYPNPFNPQTTIAFQMPTAAHVSLKVYDILGHTVATLVSKTLPPGKHTYQWNAVGLASGIYYYRIETRQFSKTMKALLIK